MRVGPFLSETKQGWKLGLFFALLGLPGIPFLLDQAVGLFGGWTVQPYLVVFGLSGPFVALLFASLSIRCPACHFRLFWHAIRNDPSGSWLNWLTELSVCPRCEHRAPSAA